MAILAPMPKFRDFLASGEPNAGGKIYTYEAGTSTPKATFSAADGTEANANPVILDSNGEASIWLDEGAYKIIVTDAADVERYTTDNVPGAEPAVGSGIDLGLIGGSANALSSVPSPPVTSYTEGLIVWFKALATNTGPATFQLNGLDPAQLLTAAGGALSPGAIIAGGSYGATFRANAFYLLNRSDFLPLTGGQITGTLKLAYAGDVAPDGSGVLDLATLNGNVARVTGTAGISSFGTTSPAGVSYILLFAAALTVTYNATTLKTPGNRNLFTAAGGYALVVSRGSGVFDLVYFPQTVDGRLPRGHLAGMTIANNATDSSNDIDIASGVCRSSDDTEDIAVTSLRTKRLDANWAVGTNQGFLDTGSKANSTTYHVYAIKHPATGTTDYIASTSASAPTLPTGYTKYRRIASLMTDGTGAIRQFVQVDDHFYWETALSDYSGSPGGANITLTVPAGIAVRPLLHVGSSTQTGITIQTPGGNSGGTSITANFSGAPVTEVFTNTSRQLAASGSSIAVTTYGWVDTRGRFA